MLARPETALFLGFVLVLLGYELLLALTVPPNTWDSLTYHLARAAAWLQHGGYFWIPNAPTDRLNEFQPLAEQEILFLFAATGSGALFALPQYLGRARDPRCRLRIRAPARFRGARGGVRGVPPRDLLARRTRGLDSAERPGGRLLPGGRRLPAPRRGSTSGRARRRGGRARARSEADDGTRAPGSCVPRALRGRRRVSLGSGGAFAGFALVGMWGYVLQTFTPATFWARRRTSREHDVAVLARAAGHGALHRVLDDGPVRPVERSDRPASWRSGCSPGSPWVRSRSGAGRVERPATPPRSRSRSSPARSFCCSAPLLTSLAPRWGHPIRGPGGVIGGLTRRRTRTSRRSGRSAPSCCSACRFSVSRSSPAAGGHEDARARLRLFPSSSSCSCSRRGGMSSSRGSCSCRRSLGAASCLALPRPRSGRGVPRRRLDGGDAHGHARAGSPIRPPAMAIHAGAGARGRAGSAVARALTTFDRVVPAHACVGAVLGVDEPSYLLFGPRFEHRVRYLHVVDPVHQALVDGLFYVVISTGPNRWVAGRSGMPGGGSAARRLLAPRRGAGRDHGDVLR